MTYHTGELYSKNANGKVIVWEGRVTEDAETIIRTGQLNGNIREIKHVTTTGKNIGKRNSTTAYQQAIKELKSKYKTKLKHGYKRLEDLGNDIATLDLEGRRLYEVLDTRLAINKTDANDVLKPMKAVQFKKVTKFHFPYIVQPKINGLRSVLLMVKDLDNTDLFSDNKSRIKLLSKEGHEYSLPHITTISSNLFIDNIAFDGELYKHNEILSNIRSRVPMVRNNKVSNASLDSNPIKFYCFDLSVPDISQLERLKMKDELLHGTTRLDYVSRYNKFILTSNTPGNIVNVSHVIANNLDDLYKYLNAALDSGYEGIVARELDAEYMFGGRRTNMIKMKKTISSEFKILDIIKKNEDSNRTYISFVLKNNTNDRTFEVTPNGNEEQRLEYLNNADKYIGKIVTLDFYERTVYDIPFHILNVTIRDEFDMDINDLQIEL